MKLFENARRERLQKDCNGALIRLARGDTDALAIIYHRMARLILSMALQITDNLADAEDVLQDVLLKLTDAAGSYAPDSNAVAWILRITRNLALNKIKERRRALPLETFEDVMNPSDDIDQACDKLTLDDALKRLSEEDRTVLQLRYGPGLTFREIARVMDSTDSAVEKRCERAVARLRQYIDPDLPPHSR